MYALKLSYDVSVANDDKASGVSFGIHPLNDLLYESPFQSQLVTVRDANGKIVHHSDAWPHKYKASSLSSGTYKVDIDLRHESESVGKVQKSFTHCDTILEEQNYRACLQKHV